jgi:hypothetical protein
MKVLPLGDAADALKPSSVIALGAAGSYDLRIVLTIIKYAENMAHLMAPRSTTLTRLANADTSDFHYGTPATGVLLRPIDEHGQHLATDGTRTSLSTVYSVAILAVGLSLKEALK